MKIKRLRLKGFIGIKKGLGLEEISVNFSELSGLIALAGPNGHGKTTVLDSMQPYRTLASRKRALKHHVFLRDSEKELEFDLNGDHYRSLIKIDSGSDRSEGYLWKNGHSLVDGKVTSYDLEIIKLFGSPELFFNSVFCAQNSDKLNEMTTGDLKKLFSEFLRLDRLVEYEKTSKQCSILYGNKFESIDHQVDKLLAIVRGKEDVEISLSSVKTQMTLSRDNLKQLDKELIAYRDELQKTEAAIQKNKLLNVRIKELKAEKEQADKAIEAFEITAKKEVGANASAIGDTELLILEQNALLEKEKEIREAAEEVQGLSTTKTNHDTNIQVLENSMQALVVDHGRLKKEAVDFAVKEARESHELTAKIITVELDILNSQSLLENEEEIRDAAKQIGELVTEIEDTRKLGEKENKRGTQLRDEYEGAYKRLSAAKRELLDFQSEAWRKEGAITHETDTARLKLEDLDKKDPQCTSKICSFIVGALEAEKKLPELEKSLAELHKSREIKEKEIKLNIDKVKEESDDIAIRLKASSVNLKGLKDTYRELDTRLKKLQPMANELSKVELAAQRKIDYEKRLAELNKESGQLAESNTEQKIKLANQLILTKKQIKEVEENIGQEVDSRGLINDKLKNLQNLANDLPKVELAAQRKSDHKKRLAELNKAGVEITESLNARRFELDMVSATIEESLNKVAGDIDNEAEINQIAIQAKIDRAVKLIDDFNKKTIPELQADALSLTRKIDEIEVAEKDLAEAQKQKELYMNESSEWAYLKNGCSKDGLRALEIDSVAPVITGYANDLLTGTFGPSNTIRFRTQDEETLREIFDILIIREDGDEDLLDDLSGGQKVWNLKALRLAMTLISKEKSGKNFLSAMADEEDGALDVENARNFIGLYRAFMQAGGFGDFYYISHKAECVAMADHIIDFNGNGISVK